MNDSDYSYTTAESGRSITVSVPEFKWPIWAGYSNMDSPKKEEKNMKSLYQVYVVTENEELIINRTVVAEDETDAQFQADVHGYLKLKGHKPSNVTIIITKLGCVKGKDKTQKVRIVEKEGE